MTTGMLPFADEHRIVVDLMNICIDGTYLAAEHPPDADRLQRFAHRVSDMSWGVTCLGEQLATRMRQAKEEENEEREPSPQNEEKEAKEESPPLERTRSDTISL